MPFRRKQAKSAGQQLWFSRSTTTTFEVDLKVKKNEFHHVKRFGLWILLKRWRITELSGSFARTLKSYIYCYVAMTNVLKATTKMCFFSKYLNSTRPFYTTSIPRYSIESRRSNNNNNIENDTITH